MQNKEKNSYQILRKNIQSVKLDSLTEQYWYDSDGDKIYWSGSTTLPPSNGYVIYNDSGLQTNGYYKWSGSTWVQITKAEAYGDYYLPVFLETSVDEMGVMVGFDGEMEQVEQICNFSYTQTGNTVQVYNTVNTSKTSQINDVVFVVNWGDGSTSGLSTTNITTTHTYVSSSGYTVSISIDTPWTQFVTKKIITVPSNTTVTNPLGTFSGFTIPYTTITGQTIDYLNNLDYTNNTGYTTFNYASVGKSRISEKKLYGSNTYSGVTTGTTSGVAYSAYTIDGLYYQDFEDGITTITGATSGYTKEEVYNLVLTRNEHFIGFIDEPVIYSDIFVERGKQGVLEKSLRLSEIDSTGEIEIYGNGYFNIRKQ